MGIEDYFEVLRRKYVVEVSRDMLISGHDRVFPLRRQSKRNKFLQVNDAWGRDLESGC